MKKTLLILISSILILQTALADERYDAQLANCKAECASKGQEAGAQLVAVGQTGRIPPSFIFRCACNKKEAMEALGGFHVTA